MGNQFPTLSWNNKVSQLYLIIHDTDLCEDIDHVNEFSIIVKQDKKLILDTAQRVVLFFEKGLRLHVGHPCFRWLIMHRLIIQ